MLNKKISLPKKIIALLCLLIFTSMQIFSITQTIEWKPDPNALEYKIEIVSLNGGKKVTLKSDSNSVLAELDIGSYRYRIIALDFLGRESSVSDWTDLEVLKSSTPIIESLEESAELAPEIGKVNLGVQIVDVTAGTVVELVNKNGEVFKGTIHMAKDNVSSGGSETERADTISFDELPSGEYKLRITNPSGKTTESDYINIQPTIAETPSQEEQNPPSEETANSDVEPTEDKTTQDEATQDEKTQDEATTSGVQIKDEKNSVGKFNKLSVIFAAIQASNQLSYIFENGLPPPQDEKTSDETANSDVEPTEDESTQDETTQDLENPTSDVETDSDVETTEDESTQDETTQDLTNPPSDVETDSDVETTEDESTQDEATQDLENPTSDVKTEDGKFNKLSVIFAAIQASNQLKHIFEQGEQFPPAEKQSDEIANEDETPSDDATTNEDEKSDDDEIPSENATPTEDSKSDEDEIPSDDVTTSEEPKSNEDAPISEDVKSNEDAAAQSTEKFNKLSVIFSAMQAANQLRAEAEKNGIAIHEKEINDESEPEKNQEAEPKKDDDLSWLPIHPYYPAVMPEDIIWRKFFVGPFVTIFSADGLEPEPEPEPETEPELADDQEGEEVIAVEPVLKEEPAKKKETACVDLIFAVGLGAYTNPINQTITQLSDWDIIPEVNAHLTWLPYKGKKWKLGYELSGKMFPFISSSEYHNSNIFLYMVQFNLVYQHTFFSPNLFWSLRLGGGAAIIDEKIDYFMSNGSRQDIDTSSMHLEAQTGLSLFWIPAKHFTIESGVDASFVLDSILEGIILDPYISFGLRL